MNGLSPVQVGWILACSFIIVIVIIGMTWNLAWNNMFKNPFAPFIRAFESRQQHRHEMQKLKWRADAAKHGIDPEYIKVMEKELHDRR